MKVAEALKRFETSQTGLVTDPPNVKEEIYMGAIVTRSASYSLTSETPKQNALILDTTIWSLKGFSKISLIAFLRNGGCLVLFHLYSDLL